MTTKDESIVQEIEKARKDIKTDYYHMSIGEIINLYQEGDIKLNPAYQRLFRWDDEQKTNFIESLIIGIPIPPIFVAQKDDGKWDIVDGVQRISTILQLTGDLKDKGPLSFTTCKYIPSIEGKTWNTLPVQVQRLIKRSKLTVNIILTENSISSQYEVFQRLNTGGLHLSDQEIRNCLIIMSDGGFYDALNEFKENSDFVNVTPISNEKFQEEFRMELILRYFIAKKNIIRYENYKIYSMHVRNFIDSETLNLIDHNDFDLAEELSRLGTVLKFLNEKLGDKVFEKYVLSKDAFERKFNLQVFEALLPGLATYYEKVSNYSADDLKGIVKSICSSKEYVEATRHGVKALKRYKELSEYSLKYFSEL